MKKKEKTGARKIIQNFLVVILIFFVVSAVFAFFNSPQSKKISYIPFSKMVLDINNGKIKSLNVFDKEIDIVYTDGKKAKTKKEQGVSVVELLKDYGLSPEKMSSVEINIKEGKTSILGWIIPIFSILPFFLFIWFFWMMFRQTKGTANQTFNFLKPPAKIFNSKNSVKEKITFDDIADLVEVKEEIREIVDFLKSPKKYWKIGARIPRGVLLVGPPGTGKTMIARAVANEANVPFFSIVGSEFIELFVGVGASRTRSLFEAAKKNQPSIIFIDELDAIGKARMPGFGGGHEEREQTLNQILAEMDGFEKETGVIVLAATNKPESLDPALLRPGRFDRRIVFDLPDINGRREILRIHCRNKPLSSEVNLTEVAERTSGFSGADLANLVNEAAILTAKRAKEKISQSEFLESIEKVLLGPERKSHLLNKEEKERSAYHESGHALVSYFLAKGEKIHKVSIISRGLAAGYTLSLPKEERRLKTKSEFLADLAVLLGGYCAEKIKFGEISTGASNDLERASLLARDLVTKYGMSRLGPISFGRREGSFFLGIESEEKNYSEKTASLIDEEVKKFIIESEKKATNLLKTKKRLLDKLAKTLIEKETIERNEFEKIISARSNKKRGV